MTREQRGFDTRTKAQEAARPLTWREMVEGCRWMDQHPRTDRSEVQARRQSGQAAR